MSSQPPFPPGAGGGEQRQPTEEELRAAYEQQVKQLRVEDVVVQTLVSLVNLAGRKAGLVQGSEDERDLQQLKLAIDGARSLLGLVDEELGEEGKQIRDALSQLQMAYVQLGGEQGGGEAGERPTAPQQPPAGGPQGGEQGGEQGGGPAQRSGRLWVPGQ